MKGGTPPLTEPSERDRAVLAMVAQGVPRKEIAKAHSIHCERVGQIVGRWGGGRGPQVVPHPVERVEEARVLWDQGLSQAEVGRRLGLTKNSIASMASRYGFSKRRTPAGFLVLATSEAVG